jgi:hypothetical protein
VLEHNQCKINLFCQSSPTTVTHFQIHHSEPNFYFFRPPATRQTCYDAPRSVSVSITAPI